ncbi:DEAD/DEAH box helicase [Streptomyces sp. NPDC020597]|uniref:DEAD/DEAH box helicase n=1 Tax=unclassified Streptomyces TaxID=2593676 RepID=UPI0037A1DB58
MFDVSGLSSYEAPAELISVWEQHIQTFTDVQERAIRAGALDGRTNLLVMAPTSSGKTLVGELAATSSAFARRQHSIFIVPFRALADEHYELFRERYGHLLSVVISTSDWTEFDADIRAGNFNLAVMTYEKLMIFLAHQPDLIQRCTTLVIDEVQLLSDGARGAKLEMLLTQVLVADKRPQIVALSASVDGVNGLETWLDATMVSSSERPVPLTQSVCSVSGSAEMLDRNEATRTEVLIPAQNDREEAISAITHRYLGEGKQIIIFRSTVRKVVETARRLRTELPAIGISQEISERFNSLDDSDAVNDLGLCLSAKVGYHTADLTHPERRLVEEAFRSGEVRVLVATTTLAMGVNLPSDVVIVGDTTRHVPAKVGWSLQNISVAEYRNAAGRAGRLGQSSAGFSVLIAEHDAEMRQLVNAYLLGHIEPIESQIPKRPFADVVFEAICAGTAQTEDELINFLASTFAYTTFYETVGGGFEELRRAVTEAVTYCVSSDLVIKEEIHLHPTPMAKIFGAAGISISSASRLAATLKQAEATQLTDADIVFDVTSCTEVGDRPWVRRRYGVDVDPRPQHSPAASASSPGSNLAVTLGRRALTPDDRKSLIRAKCLLDWMAGKPQRAISSDFRDMGAAASRVRDLGKYAAWLLDTLAQAAEVRGVSEALADKFRALALAARYGLPAELAPLARLRVAGVSREHLLKLFTNPSGKRLHEPETFLEASDDDFEGLLTPAQVARLRNAIVSELEDSLRRKQAGHVARSEQAGTPRKIVEDLYTAKGEGLEQAITDALNHIGVSATRIMRQPHGEEDIRVTHPDGTIIVSVTASQHDTRLIKWNKAKEILGAGTGLNPINYVCVGRPGFDALAERSAQNIAREAGARSISLIPIPVLAELVVRVDEGLETPEQLADLLARHRGVMTIESLPSTP